MKEIFLLNKDHKDMLTPLYNEYIEEMNACQNPIISLNDENFNNQNIFHICLYAKDQIIGFCFVEKNENGFNVLNFYIKQEFRKKHYGKYLATKTLKQLNGNITISANIKNTILVSFFSNVLLKFKNIQTTKTDTSIVWNFVNKVDNRSLSEKIEDTMDNVVGGAQDLIYGDTSDYTYNIPATMPDPDNEIKKINKVQTRRNFNKRLFKNGLLLKIFLSIFIIGGIICLFYFVGGLLLK